MNNTKSEYQKRLDEIGIYFDSLKFIDSGNCKIVYTNILGEQSERIINDELSKILKANGFLLLYNLVEATIRSSINAIFEAMQTQNVTFRCLTDNLRKLWIGQEIKNIQKENILALSKKILEEELISFKSECVNISGNIDAQKIRDIARQFGYQESRDGRDLQTIKDKRNKLAHGEFTFSEIGKDYTFQDLINYKTSTQEFLSDVLVNIETFIKNKDFALK